MTPDQWTNFFRVAASVVGALVSVTIGWFLALSTPFVSHRLMLQCRGPKLECECWPEETPTNITGIRQLYGNVRVSNLKPRFVRQCRGYLLKIEEIQGDRPVVVFERTMQCIWEFDNRRDYFDIPLGASPSFNVVMIQDEVQGFSPRMRLSSGKLLTPIPYLHVFQQYGKFQFSGIVTADDLEPLRFAFKIEWRGTWPPIFSA